MGTNAGFSRAGLEHMRKILAAYVERGEVAGIVTLLNRGGATHVECVGYRDLERREPIARDLRHLRAGGQERRLGQLRQRHRQALRRHLPCRFGLTAEHPGSRSRTVRPDIPGAECRIAMILTDRARTMEIIYS